MEKFILAVLVDGKFQKELANGTVNIPFGAEYKLRLRNRNSRRAVAKLFVDGENISGGGFIVPANQYVDIERPVDTNKKFRFVSLDSGEAIDHGKNGSNHDKVKGLVEVRWHLEVEPTYISPIRVLPLIHSVGMWSGMGYSGYGKGALRSTNNASVDQTLTTQGTSDARVNASDDLLPKKQKSMLSFTDTKSGKGHYLLHSELKDGCTVEGDVSNDQYQSGCCNYESAYVTTKLFLQGFNPGNVEEHQHVAASTPTYRLRSVEPSPSAPSETERLDAENIMLEARIFSLKRNERLKAELAELEA